MFIIKIGEHEVIFDSEEVFNFIMKISSMKTRKRSLWVDTSNSKPYAHMYFCRKNLKIHHLIVGCPIKGNLVDHLNGNSLDNRSSNLRVVTRGHNIFNRPSRGKLKMWVVPQKNGKFQAQVRIGLGTYDTEEEAHKVALEYVIKNNKNLYIHEGFL